MASARSCAESNESLSVVRPKSGLCSIDSGSFSAFLRSRKLSPANIPLCCSVLVATHGRRCCSVFLGVPRCCSVFLGVPRCSSVLLGVPRCSSVLLGVARCSSVFLAVARCCSVLLALDAVLLGVPRCSSVLLGLLALELFGVAHCGVFRSFLVSLGVSGVDGGWEPPSVRLGVFG